MVKTLLAFLFYLPSNRSPPQLLPLHSSGFPCRHNPPSSPHLRGIGGSTSRTPPPPLLLRRLTLLPGWPRCIQAFWGEFKSSGGILTKCITNLTGKPPLPLVFQTRRHRRVCRPHKRCLSQGRHQAHSWLAVSDLFHLNSN